MGKPYLIVLPFQIVRLYLKKKTIQDWPVTEDSNKYPFVSGAIRVHFG